MTKGRLVLTRKEGESIVLSDQNGNRLMEFKINKIYESRVKIAFKGLPNIKIDRKECLDDNTK